MCNLFMYRYNGNNGRASYVDGGGYTKEDCISIATPQSVAIPPTLNLQLDKKKYMYKIDMLVTK